MPSKVDYEAQRLENLAQKQKLLAELNLNSSTIARSVRTKTDPDTKTTTKKRRVATENVPSRTSARISGARARPNYNEDAQEKYNMVERKSKTAKQATGSQRHIKQETIISNDVRSLIPSQDAEEIRACWTQWMPTAPPPTRDSITNTFHFPDHPNFTPNKSPSEILHEGAFGGSYFRPLKSRKLGILIQDDWKGLPPSWIQGLDVHRYLINPVYDADANKYKVSCGQSIEEWEAAGWIAFEYDIRGWFQWYCRFFQGRRCEDDERQVSRWRKCVGETGRWRRLLLKKYLQMGVREVFDDGEDEDRTEVSPVMHQTCHHWAFEVRQDVLDEAWRSGR